MIVDTLRLLTSCDMMRGMLAVGLLGAVAPGLAMGCRAHPASLAMMMIGDAVDDADIKKRAEALEGNGPAAADAMFGSRYDTFTDTRGGKQWLIYEDSQVQRTFYVVRLARGRIESLTKVKRDADGFEDVIKQRDLEGKLLGKSPGQCQRLGGLPKPDYVVQSERQGGTVRVYNVRSWSNTRGARYCLLAFDAGDRCRKIEMMGLTAASQEADYQR